MRTGLFVVGISLLLWACTAPPFYQKHYEMDGHKWASRNVQLFEVEVKDTVSQYDFFIDVRHGEAYPFANLFLFVELDFPNGKKAVDTLECYLADPKGNWLGSGIGDLHDNRILYKRKAIFPIPGSYTFHIQQAMRIDTLPAIHDVGFIIRESKL